MPDPPPLPPAVQQQLANLQAMNQQYQLTQQQRAQYEAMKAESEQALEALAALGDEANVYRNVGAILVKEPSKKAAHDRLKDDLETLGVRLARIQKQEAQLKQQMTDLQAKLQTALKGKA